MIIKKIFVKNYFEFSFKKKYIILPNQFKKNKAMSQIEEKVKAIIVDKLGINENEVIPEASFTNDLGADSLDTVELIMEFEKEFNLSIPDEDAEKITTVGEAIDYINQHIQK